MFDIFVVVCKDDYEQLKILGRSIDKFCYNFPINNIVIIGNDRHENMSGMLESQRHYFGQFLDKVKIHDYTEIYNGPWYDGYDVQQILKLYAYKICTSENIMILDAKNFFIKNFKLSEVIRNNKFRAVYDTVADFWLENKIFTHKLFDLPHDARQIMVRTPFFIARKTLIECEFYLKENFNLLPQDIIGHNAPNKTNEFMLLQSFILKKYGNFDEYFFFTNDTPHHGNYNSGMWPVDVKNWIEYHWDLVDDKKVKRDLERILISNWSRGDHIFCSSVHRRAIRLMNDDAIEQLKFFWVKLELCNYIEATETIESIKRHD
jgi:hypothetical protein